MYHKYLCFYTFLNITKKNQNNVLIFILIDIIMQTTSIKRINLIIPNYNRRNVKSFIIYQ